MDKALVLAKDDTITIHCSRCHSYLSYPLGALGHSFVKTTNCVNIKCKRDILIINVDAFKSLICWC